VKSKHAKNTPPIGNQPFILVVRLIHSMIALLHMMNRIIVDGAFQDTK